MHFSTTCRTGHGSSRTMSISREEQGRQFEAEMKDGKDDGLIKKEEFDTETLYESSYQSYQDDELNLAFERLAVEKPPDRYSRQPPSGSKRRVCYVVFGGSGAGVHYNWASARYHLDLGQAWYRNQGYSSYVEGEEAYQFFLDYNIVPLSPEHGGISKTRVPSSSISAGLELRSDRHCATEVQPPPAPNPLPSSSTLSPFQNITMRSPAKSRQRAAASALISHHAQEAPPSLKAASKSTSALPSSPLQRPYSRLDTQDSQPAAPTPAKSSNASPTPFFVVCTGLYPGVYEDYAEAWGAAAQGFSHGSSKIHVADSRQSANQLLVDRLMASYS